MLWPTILVFAIGFISNKATPIDTKLAHIRPNVFDPVLSSNEYFGHIQENERIVQLQPSLSASDADPSNSPNGKICGYDLSVYKHDDMADEASEKIPFIVDLVDGQAVLKLKSNINKLDCEIKKSYRLFIRAYDCASDNERRYSERSSLIITVDDVNEFAPIFTHKSYLFKLYQDQNCLSCRVEATDDDCTNADHRVCDYQITTPDVPFSINSNGSISVTKTLTNDKYEFNVIAVDCYPSSDDSTKKISEPATVTVKVIKSCKPKITDNNPTKLTVQSDHTHIFENVHVDSCPETCAVESIVGTVTLDSNGIDSGCNVEQCSLINREYTLIEKDEDYNQAPQSHIMSFDGLSGSKLIPKMDFSGQFAKEFTIRTWMKHDNKNFTEKEHIFCKSDEKLKNRHHMALFVQDNHLKLLIRKGPSSGYDNNIYASEWMWKLSQINDDQWHSYKLFINYPDKIDLYIDDELFIPSDDNTKIIEDFALPIIDGTEGTTFVVGACWHARASRMVQHFHGQLSGLSIEQKEELPKSVPCTQECQQYLEMPDVEIQSGIEFESNSNRSVWIVRTDSNEVYEQVLKHIVYRNTFDPIGPSGQRTISIQTTLKCLGENYTYNLPAFTRRVSIDEVIRSMNTIELKGDTNFFVPEEIINQGILLFGNLSITTDADKKDLVDISDCSINTTPELTNDEQLIVPDDSLDINNLQKDPTQTGVILSGLGSLEIYQYVLRHIAYISKSPVRYVDRIFSLVCVGTHDQISTNEIRVRVHVEKQAPQPAPDAAAALSNKLYVDNDQIRDSIFDIDDGSRSAKYVSGWPLVVVVCVSIGLASILVLYIVVRIRSGNRQRSPLTGSGDDAHSQMEWEDDIGLNIIVNPLDTTKKPTVQSLNEQDMKQSLHKYEGTSSDEDEYVDHSHSEYSSEEDEEDEEDDSNQIHARKGDHQLEWDDEAMEYGPKQV